MSVSTVFDGNQQNVVLNGGLRCIEATGSQYLTAPEIYAGRIEAKQQAPLGTYTPGEPSSITLAVLPTPLPPTGAGIVSRWDLDAGTGIGAGAPPANCLSLYSYFNGTFLDELLQTTPATANDSATTPSLLNLTGAQQSGTVVISAGNAISSAVTLTGVDAASIIMLTVSGAAAAAAQTVSVVKGAGSFQVACVPAVAALATLTVDYFVVKL
jgi:hypothetical protein